MASHGEKAVATDGLLGSDASPEGKIVTCVTATFGYRGRLMGITPDHYILGQPLVKIIDYGQMDSYSKGKNSNAENGERAIEGVAMIERCANVAIEVSEAYQKSK